MNFFHAFIFMIELVVSNDITKPSSKLNDFAFAFPFKATPENRRSMSNS